MRAHTITTTYRNCQRRRHFTALALALGALAIPASATAQPADSVGDYSSVSAITGASDESTQLRRSPDYSSVNSIVPPESQPGAAHEVDSGYASLNAIGGPPDEEPTVVSGPAGENDGFDWVSALVGAGTALAVAAFGGIALLTLRRRTAITPSASTS
jgi:hypothetical protein